MLVTIGEIIKRFRTEGACVKLSPETIAHMANIIGYTKRRIGGKVGYDKSLITAISQRFKEAVDYEKGLGMKKAQKPLKQSHMQPRQLDYVGYNGERDNVDYGWEKNENTIKEGNMENLTILWLDDQRDPYKYLKTKSTSATFARNKQFYDNLLRQYHANFVWVKNLYQFIDYIEKNGVPQFVSFDHDLNNRGGGEGLSDEQKLNNNGVNCAKWLVNYCKQMGQPLPKFYVHSANPKHGPEINRVLTSENKKMKKIIRLTESDLHRIVKESVNRILNEWDDDDDYDGYDDWFSEEDITGNIGDRSLNTFRTYDTEGYTLEEAKRDALKEGFSNLNDYLEYFIGQVENGDWCWGTDEDYEGGYKIILISDNWVVKEWAGQLIFDEYNNEYSTP